jgi:hypothetical protein
MAAKFAILIGIDNTAGMDPLAAAAQSAKSMEIWAKSQGFETILFVDSELNEVRADTIVDALEKILESSPQQVIIYFAGHGCSRTAGSEIWFLPKAITRGEEAFDLVESKAKAYQSGVDSIVFISDACRTAPNDNRIAMVSGRSLFPNMSNRNPSTKIDMLYAAWPGDPAHETRGEDGDYSAIYTECLLTCLKGGVKEIIMPIQKLQPSIFGVMPHELNEYLTRAIPTLIINRGLFFKQQPMGEVTSRDPIYLSKIEETELHKAEDNKTGTLDLMFPFGEKGAIYIPNRLERLDKRYDRYIGLIEGSLTAKNEKDSEQRLMVRNAQNFYNEMVIEDDSIGFAVNGPGVFRFYQNFSSESILFSNDRLKKQSNTRITPGKSYLNIPFKTATVVVAVSDFSNTGFPIAVIPGFFCIISFKDNQIISVDYFPTDRMGKAIAQYESASIAERKAMVIAAATNGFFEGSEEAGDYLRQFKSLDPTLGLFAAYAYARSGKYEDIESVYRYIRREDNAVLFDIELLRNLTIRDFNRPLAITEMIPILTQGWSYLSMLNPDERLLKITNMLKPGLWTTFTPNGIDYLIEQFKLKEF